MLNRKKISFVILTMLVIFFSFIGCAKKVTLKEDNEPQQPATIASKQMPTAASEAPGTNEASRKRTGAERTAGEATLKAQEETKDSKSKRESANKQVGNLSKEIFELADIYFDFDKSILKDETRASLNNYAVWLTKNKNMKIVIEGNCDERGTAEYNLALGQRRANAAAKYLIDMGIGAKRIKTVSYGFEKPLDKRHNEEAWAKNRRDHFVVSEN